MNLIILQSCPTRVIQILSPHSEKMIITFHFEVSREQLPISTATYADFVTSLQTCMGTYHTTGISCMLLPCKPMGHILGLQLSKQSQII